MNGNTDRVFGSTFESFPIGFSKTRVKIREDCGRPVNPPHNPIYPDPTGAAGKENNMTKAQERALIKDCQQIDEDVLTLEDCIELMDFLVDDLKQRLGEDTPPSLSSC